MCTFVILRRCDHAWPVVIAANRDEMAGRAWDAPGRHWPDRANIIGGLDRLGGGTWLGINDQGLVAGVLNRRGTLGASPDFRSRGELPLEALDHAEAEVAAEALADINPGAYRPFNLIVADARRAFAICAREDGVAGRAATITVEEIPQGLSMITAHDLDDMSSPRIRHFRPLFAAAPEPDPDTGDWKSWSELLASRDRATGEPPASAMNIATDSGFGTVSSSLIALPKPEWPKPEWPKPEWTPQNPPKDPPRRPVWLFAAGRPGDAPFCPVIP